MGKEELEVLEALIEKHGLEDVLSKLSYLCSKKSEHVAAHWQDNQLAKLWMWWSQWIDRVSARVGQGGGYEQTVQ